MNSEFFKSNCVKKFFKRINFCNLIVFHLSSQAGKLIKLYVTHIDKHGMVYAQLDTLARNLLNDEIMAQAFANNMTNSSKGLNFTKMYLVKWNSQLYRARVTDIPNDEVTVFLIDVGKTVTTSRKNLFPIENFSKTLQCIPPQVKQKFFFFFLQKKCIIDFQIKLIFTR